MAQTQGAGHDGTHADDLVQETLVKAWDKFDSFKQGTNLSAWLATILRNTFLSEKRKRRREVEDGEGKLAGHLSVLPEQPGHMDLIDLRDAMTRLPEAQCSALLLVGASGFSYKEVAEMCGCAVGTIKSRVGRARASLVELLHPPAQSGPETAVAIVADRWADTRAIALCNKGVGTWTHERNGFGAAGKESRTPTLAPPGWHEVGNSGQGIMGQTAAAG